MIQINRSIRSSDPAEPNVMGMDGMNSPGGLLGVMVTRVIPALIPWFSVS